MKPRSRPNKSKTSRPEPGQIRLIALNKPFDVLCQFTDEDGRQTLADFVDVKDVYAAGRLDRDSEGLLLLTNSGKLQQKIASPKFKMAKSYWVQLEGEVSSEQIKMLCEGVELKDGRTKPAKVSLIEEPKNLWPRVPPIRERKTIPTSWLNITIKEGKNRQIRRMTAHVGLPTLRLIRHSIGPWSLGDLALGKWKNCDV